MFQCAGQKMVAASIAHSSVTGAKSPTKFGTSNLSDMGNSVMTKWELIMKPVAMCSPLHRHAKKKKKKTAKHAGSSANVHGRACAAFPVSLGGLEPAALPRARPVVTAPAGVQQRRRLRLAALLLLSSQLS